MTKHIAHLLQISAPLLIEDVSRLERAAGSPAEDIRLTSEIHASVSARMKALGLDPQDTTAEELYHAVTALMAKHEAFLLQRLGIKASDSNDVALQKIVQLIEKMNIPKTAWVVKHAALKQLLKKQPPKKVMKQLRYRSLESMLKRESVSSIVLGIRLLETPAWQKKFVASYAGLQPSDFEQRTIEIIIADEKKWGNDLLAYVQQRRRNLLRLRELGVVVVMPLPQEKMKRAVLLTLTHILYYMNDIRSFSAHIKSRQMHADFGVVLADVISGSHRHHAQVKGWEIPWRVVHRHYGSGHAKHPADFEPHVSEEDIEWHVAENVLYKLEPALHFWHDTRHVAALMGDNIVSFNLMDVASNYANNAPFERQSIGYFQQSLHNELMSRYLAHSPIEMHVLEQIVGTADNQTINTELQ